MFDYEQQDIHGPSRQKINDVLCIKSRDETLISLYEIMS